MSGLQVVRDGFAKAYAKEARRPDGTIVELVSVVGPGEAARAILALHRMARSAEPRRRGLVEELAENFTQDELERELQRPEAAWVPTGISQNDSKTKQAPDPRTAAVEYLKAFGMLIREPVSERRAFRSRRACL